MKLAARRVEKPWGRERLPAPFAGNDGKVGEIWFEPPPDCDALLAKYIFTSEKLSVQVHPPGGGKTGKDECWLVLDAEPGAEIAIGFAEPVSPERIRTAALDGSIEGMLAWHPVRRNDFFFLPAGTVHAIGAGIGLVEIQQNCDVTYRLYDYGRPRKLHVDEAMAVASGLPHDPALRRSLASRSSAQLVDGPHFRLDRLVGLPDAALARRYERNWFLVLPLDCEIEIGGDRVAPGECAIASSLSELSFSEEGQSLLAQACEEGEDLHE